MQGDAFSDQLSVFNGTDWRVNDIIRFFDGVSADFWELGSIKTTTLLNNTTASVFEVSVTNSENWVISYSILRGAAKETGQIYITSDGTTVSVTRGNTFIGDTGVEFTGDVSVGDLRLRYTTDASGASATMKYFVQRWSNAPGGPSAVPNYSGLVGPSIPAAGSVGEIQFHGSSGNLDADSNLAWDDSEKSLDLNGKKQTVLSSGITINDNQVAALSIVTFPHATFEHAILEYSVVRNGENRTGRIVVSTNGTTVGFSDDFVETVAVGVSFTAVVNGSDLEIRYTSTSTGFTGTFKYTIKKWI